jgi:hypothetical protein
LNDAFDTILNGVVGVDINPPAEEEAAPTKASL